MNALICCILKDLIVRKGYEIFSELVALILFVSIYWVSPTNSYEEPPNIQTSRTLRAVGYEPEARTGRSMECCINIVALKETHMSMPICLNHG